MGLALKGSKYSPSVPIPKVECYLSLVTENVVAITWFMTNQLTEVYCSVGDRRNLREDCSRKGGGRFAPDVLADDSI